MLRSIHVFAFAGAFAAVALVGCNAVLGIDEAESRDDGDPLHPTSQSIPVAGCDKPGTDCGGCVSGSTAFTNCLSNHDCRKALDEYRACLGSKCSGGACFDALKAGAGKLVADVVQAECPMCEGSSPLADMCDLYCACMEQTLPSLAGVPADGKTCETYNQALDWPAADLAACKMACANLARTDIASVHCRWGHCELATNGETRGHCLHAIDQSICPLAATPNPDCKDRKLAGWACDGPQDCCSNHCVGNICGM
jgi:hypothetical protein